MPFNPQISPLYLGTSNVDSEGAVTKAMEERKNRAREYKALQELAEVRYGLPKEVTTPMGLDELRGKLQGMESKEKDQYQQDMLGLRQQFNDIEQQRFNAWREDRTAGREDEKAKSKIASDIVNILGLGNRLGPGAALAGGAGGGGESSPEDFMGGAMGFEAPQSDPNMPPPEMLNAPDAGAIQDPGPMPMMSPPPMMPGSGMDSQSITAQDFVRAYLMAAGQNNVPIRPQDLDQYFRMGQAMEKTAGPPELITRRDELGNPWVWTGGQYVRSPEPGARNAPSAPPEGYDVWTDGNGRSQLVRKSVTKDQPDPGAYDANKNGILDADEFGAYVMGQKMGAFPGMRVPSQGTNAPAAAPAKPAPTGQRIRVISPEGKLGSVPADKLDAALKAGFNKSNSRVPILCPTLLISCRMKPRPPTSALSPIPSPR